MVFKKIIRAIIILFSFLCFQSLKGQTLKNTEWIQLFAINKDSSKIIDRLMPGITSIKHYFHEDHVSISTNEQYSTFLTYSESDSQLQIGEFIKYKIDSIRDAFLTVSDIPKKGSGSDRMFTYTFLNIEYLFDYLKQNQQIDIIGDSLIIATNLFSPTYNGDFNNLLISKYNPNTGKETINGVFTISNDGNIRDIKMTSSQKKVKAGIAKITKIIQSTAGSWIIPPTPKPYQFQMNFSFYTDIDSDSEFHLTGYNFTFHPVTIKKE